MIELAKKQRKIIQDNIKRDVMRAFPGYIIKRVIVLSNGDWTIMADLKRSLPNFYHLYPGLTKAEADDRIVMDIEAIVKRYLPETSLADFDQSAHNGARHVVLSKA